MHLDPGPEDVLTMVAGEVDDHPEIRMFFANERFVMAVGTAFGELRLTATYDKGLIYVRGETWPVDFYGSGRSLSAAIRDYLQAVEEAVAVDAARRPQRD